MVQLSCYEPLSHQMNKNLAIVTVTYNAKRNLSFFLPSLIKNDEIIDAVYFVDNYSKDTTIEELIKYRESKTFKGSVEIISNNKNYGYTYAINQGIQRALDAGFEYICVTNNDIIFEKGFFAKMLHDAKEHRIDALGVPASLNAQEIGLGYSLDTATHLPRKDSPLTRNDLAQKIENNPLPAIDFPHGGTILFRSIFFKTIGMYDHHLFFGGDELDFLYRVTSYNTTNKPKIKCAVSLECFLLLDNLTQHNSGHKIIKARGMLQGNARVNLKHKFTPMEFGLYREQYILIKVLSKGRVLRSMILYMLSARGLCIEIYRYYTKI